MLMGGDNHYLLWLKIKKLRHEKINCRIGFVVADIFRRQDAVPR